MQTAVQYIDTAMVGSLGTAMASAIAFSVGGILITLTLFRHSVISPGKESMKPQWDILRPRFIFRRLGCRRQQPLWQEMLMGQKIGKK